jgi:hypothetical protein
MQTFQTFAIQVDCDSIAATETRAVEEYRTRAGRDFVQNPRWSGAVSPMRFYIEIVLRESHFQECSTEARTNDSRLDTHIRQTIGDLGERGCELRVLSFERLDRFSESLG